MLSRRVQVFSLAILCLQLHGCSLLGIGDGRTLHVVNKARVDLVVQAVSLERGKVIDPQVEWDMSNLPNRTLVVEAGARGTLSPDAILDYDIHDGITVFVYDASGEIARLVNVFDFTRAELLVNDYQIELRDW